VPVPWLNFRDVDHALMCRAFHHATADLCAGRFCQPTKVGP
jgi:hypothetical protein